MSEKCKTTIQYLNINLQISRKVTDILRFEPVYRHVIPHQTAQLAEVRLPTLRTHGRAPPRHSLSSEELSSELHEGATFARVYDLSEGAVSSSSSSGLTIDEEEEVSQLVRRR